MTLPKDTILENRYRIDRLLAHGGMGAIYHAFDTNLNMPVAIKENFLQTPQSIHQFEQEALILAHLRHPNLPRVIHHFSFEGQQYLVMDFIAGEDLWWIVKKQQQPLKEAQALDYIIQVCDAVSYLHRQKPSIIHRDIKPQNIKITPDNRAVLVDFGIAKVSGADSRTRTGAQGVTPGFSPPEQYSGVGTTPVSDVYALGATLYAVLTGKKPPDSISLMVDGTRFKPPNTINPTLSLQVSQAIEYAMQVQQADRPQSVTAWQRVLKTILESPAPVSADKEETLTPGTVPSSGREQTMAGTMAPTAATTHWLVDTTGQGYPIGPKSIVIGRHPQADVVIKVLSASREHAYIRFDGQRCLVRDNNSANGTFINNQRLGAGWQPINLGDTLAIGTSRFSITTTQPATVAPPKSKLTPLEEDGVTTLPVPPIAPVAPPPAPPTLHSAPQPTPKQTFVTPPAAPKRAGMFVLPLVIAAVIVLGAIGVAAFFLFNSGILSTPTPTPVILIDPLITPTQTAKTVDQEAKKMMTAQAEANAKSTRQAKQSTATATAKTTAQTTKEGNIPTAPPTKSPPTAPSTKSSPTATLTKSTSTPTQETPPTSTPTPTATRRPVVAGPTLIPMKSELSVSRIGTKEVTDVDINPKNPKEVYVLVKGDGIYKSSSGGDGPWARMILDGSSLTAFVIDPTNPARFFAPTWNAVLRSDDGGNSWRAFGNGLSSANRVVDVVTVDPASPNVVYAGIGDTLVISTDNGENWTSEGYGNGLQGGRLTAIVVDSFNHDVVFVGGLFGSLYKSFDSGRNFKQLAFNTGEGTFSLVAHPTKEDVYLIGINSYDAGIMKTENGIDFSSISHGLVFGGADSAYSAIAYAPGNPNIVYTGSGYEDDRFAKGIFKNRAGGEEKWESISNGLSINPATGQPHYVKAIVVHPTNPDIVLAATGGGIYKSVDGGANWGQK